MAPTCNAYAERCVLLTKSECQKRIVLFEGNLLRRACRSFVDHYHLEPTCEGLGNVTIKKNPLTTGAVERNGGLFKSNPRAA